MTSLSDIEVKRLDWSCKQAVEQFNKKGQGITITVSAAHMMAMQRMAYIFGFKMDEVDGRIYTEDMKTKTRTYVSNANK